jgi:hypothetical protein
MKEVRFEGKDASARNVIVLQIGILAVAAVCFAALSFIYWRFAADEPARLERPQPGSLFTEEELGGESSGAGLRKRLETRHHAE